MMNWQIGRGLGAILIAILVGLICHSHVSRWREIIHGPQAVCIAQTMNLQLAEAWGQFLSQFLWDWFLTLTFRDGVKSFRAHKLFASFIRELEQAAGVPIFWFRADEIGPRGGRFHIHALVGNVAHLRRLTWMHRWSDLAGYARILNFDKRKGAAYYCAKYATKQFGDWELSDNLRAFREYQPVLALTGSTKPPVLKSETRRDQRRSPKLLIRQPQYLLLPHPPKRGQSPHQPMIGEVYRSEVTRGRGRFREFFPNEHK